MLSRSAVCSFYLSLTVGQVAFLHALMHMAGVPDPLAGDDELSVSASEDGSESLDWRGGVDGDERRGSNQKANTENKPIISAREQADVGAPRLCGAAQLPRLSY